jgi:putative DNA primase/helicase
MSELTDMTDDLEAKVEFEKSRIKAREEAKRQVAEESRPAPPTLTGFTALELQSQVFPARDPIIMRDQSVVFAAGHIGEVFATRGIGKTLFLLSIALAVSTKGRVLGFHAPKPRPVLYVDGEMASDDIKDRLAMLADRMKVTPNDYLRFVAADWQDDYLPRLDTPEGQQALEPFIDQAALIIFDNRSCLLNPEGEKDSVAWQPMGEYLLSLRKRGKAVLLAHHANRQGGARGHSAAEDPMNLIIKLTRPEGYTGDQGARFVVEFDKARGLYGAAAAPFEAELTEQGWTTGSVGGNRMSVRDKIIDYLRAAELGAALPRSANKVADNVKGRRSDVLQTFAEMMVNGEIVGDKKSGFKLGVLPTASSPCPF